MHVYYIIYIYCRVNRKIVFIGYTIFVKILIIFLSPPHPLCTNYNCRSKHCLFVLKNARNHNVLSVSCVLFPTWWTSTGMVIGNFEISLYELIRYTSYNIHADGNHYYRCQFNVHWWAMNILYGLKLSRNILYQYCSHLVSLLVD